MIRFLLLLTLTLPLFAHEPDAFSIDSKVLGERRSIVVHLPASYGAGQQRYPVIYVTDGNWRAPHTADTAKALAEGGRMPEVIVVGVMNTDRIRDLTPTRITELVIEGDTSRFPTSGGASNFISFFETELIPEIDKRYRTTPYRVFAGHSFAGLFALEMLFTKPRLFQAWISVSPTIWWDGKYALRHARQFIDSTPVLNSTLVLAIGSEGQMMNGPFDELKQMFRKKPAAFSVHTYVFEEEDHGSVPVPAHYAALRRIFAPWYFEIKPIEDLKTLWVRAQAHATDISAKYGFKVNVAEERANTIGYRLLGKNMTAEAIEVFRTNVANYPDSPNAYDSLGEAYENAGDLAKARENYALAVQKAQAAKDARVALFKENLDRVDKALKAK